MGEYVYGRRVDEVVELNASFESTSEPFIHRIYPNQSMIRSSHTLLWVLLYSPLLLFQVPSSILASKQTGMTTSDSTLTAEETLAIDCEGLTYAFSEGLESALDGVDLKLKRGDRCLLVGANGGESILEPEAARPLVHAAQRAQAREQN